MKFIRQENHSNTITTYDTDGFTINGKHHSGSALLNASELVSPWTDKPLTELTLNDILAPLTVRPELLVIGCGTHQQFPPSDLYASFFEAGIGFEVMTSGAACRTFNVLMSEGRDAAVALLAMS